VIKINQTSSSKLKLYFVLLDLDKTDLDKTDLDKTKIL